MMLYINKDRLSWGKTFYVLGEDDRKKYRVEPSIFLMKKKFVVKDMNKKTLFTIQSDPMSLLKKKFHIIIDGEKKVTFSRELSLFPKYDIEGINWSMANMDTEGYDMVSGDKTVLSFRESHSTRHWTRNELTFDDPADELLALAVILTISYAMQMGDDAND